MDYAFTNTRNFKFDSSFCNISILLFIELLSCCRYMLIHRLDLDSIPSQRCSDFLIIQSRKVASLSKRKEPRALQAKLVSKNTFATILFLLFLLEEIGDILVLKELILIYIKVVLYLEYLL